ncbi:MAG: hypothetical protein E6K69_00605 [Nitrospirae bacterium]|nr:MAG: hypothetical protein E6K69_00605 [Nitrospirota bacterium]
MTTEGADQGKAVGQAVAILLAALLGMALTPVWEELRARDRSVDRCHDDHVRRRAQRGDSRHGNVFSSQHNTD